MINNEAAEKLIIFMMDKAITYRNRKLYVLGTFKIKKTTNCTIPCNVKEYATKFSHRSVQ